VPGLALRWKPVGELAWEFTLRRGVSFHNGEAFIAAASGVPQLSQNLLPAWTFAPQLEQTAPNGAPHSRQNRAPSQFFAWHRGHSMRLAPLPRYVRSVAEE
jgi:ABC-type transport system substrate-binding protein